MLYNRNYTRSNNLAPGGFGGQATEIRVYAGGVGRAGISERLGGLSAMTHEWHSDARDALTRGPGAVARCWSRWLLVSAAATALTPATPATAADSASGRHRLHHRDRGSSRRARSST